MMVNSMIMFVLHGLTDYLNELFFIIFQQQLKNIITAVLSRRNAYKSRDKRFMYSMGSEAPVTHLRNSTNIQDDSEERWV